MTTNTMKKLSLLDYELYLEEAQYTNNGAKALLLHIDEEENGELDYFCDITTNVEGYFPLNENEVLVKTWSENEPLVQPLLQCGLFEDTGRRIPTGFAEAQIWTYAG